MSIVENSLKDYVNSVSNWQDISIILDKIVTSAPQSQVLSQAEFNNIVEQGAAFVTYDFGIDGVSIEIFKYAECLERIFPGLPLHFIGGDFHEKADVILKDYWKRFTIDGFNGWDKWFGGKMFSKLFYEDMPQDSQQSNAAAKEIWKEACAFAVKLGSYLEEHDIRLAIPVNIPTNPGNVAAMLAIILVSEILGTYVISSNHDFYWEGGKPASEHAPDEHPGPRDHFFRNIDNKPFFELFKRMYPWNGNKWIQVNINSPQTKALTTKFGFDTKRVFELGTSISDKFFIHSDRDFVRSVRKRMNYIVSDGKPEITTVDIRKHIKNLSKWMHNEVPVGLGNRDGLKLDLSADKIIYCLQPTRVIYRKHIDRDLELMQSLLQFKPFTEKFNTDPEYKLLLHITGPTPIEHQTDLEDVLKAYEALCDSVPQDIADRVFLIFSVGNENHHCFEKLNLKPLCIEAIYQLADVILFPSETEGRGLPIIESSAGGIPIVCRRYYPEEVFAEVIGEKLPESEQIKYLLFPVEEFSTEFLKNVTDMLFHPEHYIEWKAHNREAVKHRYSMKMIVRKFNEFFKVLCQS
ncbi:MAG: glycosyltransferase family 4 protein [Lentisphaerae bacterium]|nr:glycosyltransferase family 4 protein [Lentisphaerota bacterium]MCP4102135.1 glycosyltransferase family 4 protein [Lentisphaerota bacterium]